MEESKDDDDLFFAPVAPFGEPRADANAAANAAGPLFSGIAGGAAAFAPFGEPCAALPVGCQELELELEL